MMAPAIGKLIGMPIQITASYHPCATSYLNSMKAGRYWRQGVVEVAPYDTEERSCNYEGHFCLHLNKSYHVCKVIEEYPRFKLVRERNIKF
jgi:hypothetical protein